MSENTNTNATVNANEHVCDCCGQIVSETTTVVDSWGNEHEWCDECLTDAHQCDHCGQWFTSSIDLTTVTNHDGNEVQWCEECRDVDAEYCEHCDSWVEGETYSVITGYSYGSNDHEHWCEDCIENDAITCDECDELVSRNESVILYMYDGSTFEVCRECRDERFRQCDECGNWVHVDDAYFDYDSCETYCPRCYDECCWPGEHIYDYHHTHGETFWMDDLTCKDAWELSDEDKKRLYAGMELEVSGCRCRAEVADSIYDEFGEDKFICKKDSTLGKRGVEIVSQPMTPLYHLNSGAWERITEIVRDNGGVSYDSGCCGLHIHVSRAALKHEDVVYRIDRLMHHFKRQMVKFSRRTNMYWCQITDDYDLCEIKDLNERKKEWQRKKEGYYDFCKGHHVALNDENRATVEYRLWRGSLNMNTIRATIEFTTGMTIVADTISDEMADGLTWSMFKMLVRYALEAANIPHDDLDEYFTRRGL